MSRLAEPLPDGWILLEYSPRLRGFRYLVGLSRYSRMINEPVLISIQENFLPLSAFYMISELGTIVVEVL